DHEIPGMISSFSKAEVLPLDLATAELAGRIHGDLDRTGQPIGRIDPLIAATAVRHGLTLATGNVRHFERVRQFGYPLTVEDWRQPAESCTP
ncbi:MAG TPA: PIN domain-containing protein, partial [Planctomycetaceae bacterium]